MNFKPRYKGSFIKLEESAKTHMDIRETGSASRVSTVAGSPTRRRVEIINEGWGSSGFYSTEVLKLAEKNKVFPEGLHMFLNHPSTREEREQPERRVEHLAAVLATDAKVEGDGLFAEADIFDHWAPVINNTADHIGLSIRAQGTAHEGEVDGQQGPIIDELTEAISVDFVTLAGRGGKVLDLIESAIENSKTATLEEARNVGEWLEAFIHSTFTQRVDDGFGEGFITREERLALSSAIGDALEAFHSSIEESSPQLFTRDPFSLPEGETIDANESWTGDLSSPDKPTKEARMGDEDRLSALEETVRQLRESHQEEMDAKDKEIKETKVAAERAEDALAMERAKVAIEEALDCDEVKGLNLPDRALLRIRDQVSERKLPMDEGKVDREVLESRVIKAAREEAKYLKGEKTDQREGAESGSLDEVLASTERDAPSTLGGGGQVLSEAEQKALEEEFTEMGTSEDAASLAVKGR
jgi:hypothetical protein